jgi:hypothetical protein
VSVAEDGSLVVGFVLAGHASLVGEGRCYARFAETRSRRRSGVSAVYPGKGLGPVLPRGAVSDLGGEAAGDFPPWRRC